ncbi:MAG TPA: isoaspartyl peptidase/L-asparaginase [Hellea balneolensis]|uniref:Isoaspartyl peptidase n=1 Tax=Hellea balneolensis TaxID=287478 RepID=A0A7C5R7D7_9PROT|nr:isoaspartyl peptidase/L-asparaginase [Hellea balneolensis]
MHGGAGRYDAKDQGEQMANLRDIANHGRQLLSKGLSALDVCEALAVQLENSGLYVAGKGTGPNSAGEYELDACIMNGQTRNVGAVCALKGFKNPVKVARAVMEKTPHIMLAGRGAENFAVDQGCERVEKPLEYYLIKGVTRLPEELDTGTVGVVARDKTGTLAAATSTGGLLGKMQGRVGDSPLPGAGCWADERVAVSCTGQGEFFIKAAIAADISARIRYGGQSLLTAAGGAIDDMGKQGGYGGVIALGPQGIAVFPYNSQGMRRAWIDEAGHVQVAV